MDDQKGREESSPTTEDYLFSSHYSTYTYLSSFFKNLILLLLLLLLHFLQLLPAAALIGQKIQMAVLRQPTLHIVLVPFQPTRFGADGVRALVQRSIETLFFMFWKKLVRTGSIERKDSLFLLLLQVTPTRPPYSFIHSR